MQQKTRTSSLVITILVIINLVLLLSLGYLLYNDSSSQKKSIPLDIKPEVIDYIATKFIRMYNQKDLSALYAQFSYAAQQSLERPHVDSEFKQLFSDFSVLSKPEFSNVEFITDYKNKKVYRVNYSVHCENIKKKKQMCLLRFTLGLDKKFPEIFGITLNQKT